MILFKAQANQSMPTNIVQSTRFEPMPNENFELSDSSVGLMKKAFSGSTPWPTTVNKAQKILVQARLTRFASSTSYSTRSSAGWCWLASLRKILLPSNILRKNFFWIFKTLWSLQGKPSHKKPSKHFFTFYSVREVNVNLGLMVKAQNLVACSMGHEFKLNC